MRGSGGAGKTLPRGFSRSPGKSQHAVEAFAEGEKPLGVAGITGHRGPVIQTFEDQLLDRVAPDLRFGGGAGAVVLDRLVEKFVADRILGFSVGAGVDDESVAAGTPVVGAGIPAGGASSLSISS